MKKFKRSVIFFSFLVTTTTQATSLFVEPGGTGIDCTSIDPCARIQAATSSHNMVEENTFKDNALGSIADDGRHNSLH